jgi:ATP-binding cassette subfamily B protein
MSSTNLPDTAWADVPAGWRSDVQQQLSSGENVRACLEVDLDERLFFARGLLIVTDRRLLASPAHVREGGSESSRGWLSWPLAAGLELQHHDHAGVGTLSLTLPGQRLAHWRFTLSRNVAAMRLQEVLNQHCEQIEQGEGRPPQLALRCPNCKRPLEHPGAVCSACEGDLHTPPSTWGLFRLWRFAKP